MEGTVKRRTLRCILVFALAGLAGPMIWLAAWPPSRLAEVLPRSVWLFYTDLVELIWPPSMMGPWIGVPANLALFTILGFAVALLGRTRRRLAMTYVVVVTLVFLMAQWEAGFVFARINLLALVVALALYAIPFWFVIRASATPQSA